MNSSNEAAARSPLSRPAALIFDMDGVLLDTERLYTVATNQVLAPFGKAFDWAVKKRMMGRAALESARILVDAYNLPLTPEEYLRRRGELLEPLFDHTEPLPGAERLVAALRHAGVPLALATSSTRQTYLQKSRPHEWFRHFNAIVCGDDPETAGRYKPAPDIFLAAARALGVKPEHCAVVEDSLAGVEAARAAGMMSFAVPAPPLREDFLGVADSVFGSLNELYECLGLDG